MPKIVHAFSASKKSKNTTFSRVFHPKKSTIFSGKQSWIFGQKLKISNSVNIAHTCTFDIILDGEPTITEKYKRDK